MLTLNHSIFQPINFIQSSMFSILLSFIFAYRGTLVAAKCIKSAKIADDWLKRAHEYKSHNNTKHGNKDSLKVVKKKESKIERRLSDKTDGGEDSGRLPSQIVLGEMNRVQDHPKEGADTALDAALDDFRTEVSIMKKLR